MELGILEAEIGKDENIKIIVDTYEIPYGELYLWGNDIKIYDQNNCEVEYDKLIEISKNYWNNFNRKK
jgi:tricorn protease-like protein